MTANWQLVAASLDDAHGTVLESSPSVSRILHAVFGATIRVQILSSAPLNDLVNEVGGMRTIMDSSSTTSTLGRQRYDRDSI